MPGDPLRGNTDGRHSDDVRPARPARHTAVEDVHAVLLLIEDLVEGLDAARVGHFVTMTVNAVGVVRSGAAAVDDGAGSAAPVVRGGAFVWRRDAPVE